MMDVGFLGYGAAFAPELGSNAALVGTGDGGDATTLLIDCGPSTFPALLHERAYAESEGMTVLITHAHADHVAGLPTMVMHSWYAHDHRRTCIVCGEDTAMAVEGILHFCGAPEEAYDIIPVADGDRCVLDGGVSVLFRRTVHVSDVASYSMLVSHGPDDIYWTGDTVDTGGVVSFLGDHGPDGAAAGRGYMAFADCSLAPNPVHASLDAWNHAVPDGQRCHVAMMHLDGIGAIAAARSCGYGCAADMTAAHPHSVG